MKPTGKMNQITGEEILKAEEQDINFWKTNWDDLTIEQKVTFCSFIGALFLGKQNEEHVRARYHYYRLKNITSFVVNRTNFYEPTPEYIKDWENTSHTVNIKDWFNGDLICWVDYLKDRGLFDEELNEAYTNFCHTYNIEISTEELVKNFSEYPEYDKQTLIKNLIETLPK